MKKILEDIDILPYVQYGLKCEILNYKNDYIGKRYGATHGCYKICDTWHYTFNQSREVAGKDVTLIKPILRPMTDLSKEVTIGDETFVPIHRLALMAETQHFSAESLFEVKDLGELGCIVLFISTITGAQMAFMYEKENKSFSLVSGTNVSNKIVVVFDVFAVIQQMYKWHFDINYLINANLAHNINTYKQL